MSFAQLGQSLGSGFAQMGGASPKGVSAAGSWGQVIGMAIQVGFDIYNGRQQRKQQHRQHERIRERNTNVLNEMMRSLATVEQDRALAMMRIQEAKWSAQQQTKLFRSNLELNQAASGMTGQTFDILASDIKRQRDEAMYRLDFNAEVQYAQYSNQSHAVINQALNATQNPAQSIAAFDLEKTLSTIGDSLPVVTGLWDHMQARRNTQPKLNSQWTPVKQNSAGLSYTLGL